MPTLPPVPNVNPRDFAAVEAILGYLQRLRNRFEDVASGLGGPPSGSIMMWFGTLATIPGGWVLCDGTNGTPDLRDRFVKGAAAGVDPGLTGGSATTPALVHSGTAVADHASHTHTYTGVPDHVHVEQAQGDTTPSLTGTHVVTSDATGGSLRSAESTLNPTGGVGATGTTAGPSATLTHAVTQPADHAAVSNEPPYFTVAYIMKT